MLTSEQRHHLHQEFSAFQTDKIRQFFPKFETSISVLEKIQDHAYSDKVIATVSLLHRSAFVYWPIDKTGLLSNERLEFLGDAILGLYVAGQVMVAHPTWTEGELSRLRAIVVGTENLAAKSRLLGISEILLVGKGDNHRQTNTLADAFEAITAALYLDAGPEKTNAWLGSIFASDLILGSQMLEAYDAKSKVQHWMQSLIGHPPSYRVVGTEATHERTEFIVAAFVGEHEIARASAVNKRSASKAVAQILVSMIDSGELTEEHIKQWSKVS